jgi:hypothetical protein
MSLSLLLTIFRKAMEAPTEFDWYRAVLFTGFVVFISLLRRDNK